MPDLVTNLVFWGIKSEVVSFSLSGLPEGVGKAGRLHTDPEALREGPDPEQRRRRSLAAGADGGAGGPLGRRVQAVSEQTGQAGGGSAAGTNCFGFALLGTTSDSLSYWDFCHAKSEPSFGSLFENDIWK